VSVEVLIVGWPELMKSCLRKHDDTERVIVITERADTFKVCLGDSICDNYSPLIRDNERLRSVSGRIGNRFQQDNEVLLLNIKIAVHLRLYVPLHSRLRTHYFRCRGDNCLRNHLFGGNRFLRRSLLRRRLHNGR
jgi:hypothetical protein